MKLTPHFDRKEFACKCGCRYDTVDVQLMQVLNDLRNHFGQPITINSGFRCPSHNKAIGGSPISQHMYGKAADIVVKNINPIAVFGYLVTSYPDRYGFGVYDNFIHVDVREKPARWKL